MKIDRYAVLRRVWLVVLLMLAGSAQVPQYEINRQVISNGSAILTGNTYNGHGVLGQNAIGSLASGAYRHGAGFLYERYDPAAVGVEELPENPAFLNRLKQNVPNPFNPQTTIQFSLAQDGHTTLRVFDVRGRRVATLVDGPMEAGEHRLVFNPKELASGVYVYRLQSGDFHDSKRFTLVK